MIREKFTTVLITGCFFAVLLTANAAFDPAYAQCETVTDAKLVEDINARIKADRKLSGQMSHINVVSINRVIKLQGWTDTKDDYNNVIEIVASTKCVVMINTQLFRSSRPEGDDLVMPDGEGGCGSGMKPCGDICIPEGDACNIGLKSR